MKQAIALLFLSFAFVCVVFGSLPEGGVANADGTCPSPAPSCTSSGTLSHLTGTFGCSQAKTDSSGQINVGVTLLNSDGSGTVSVTEAKNNNSTSTTTFTDFETTTGLSYCVNTDDTGYILPPTGKGCPMAFMIANGNGNARSEVRLIDSSENTAKLVTCRKQ